MTFSTSREKSGRSLHEVISADIGWHRTQERSQRLISCPVAHNRIGPDSLGDKRHEHPGAKTLLDDVQQAQLRQVLQSPPTEGGLWNGRKVADWKSILVGYSVSRQRGWEYHGRNEVTLYCASTFTRRNRLF